MTMINKELYDALININVEEEKARAAAAVIIDRGQIATKEDIKDLEGKINHVETALDMKLRDVETALDMKLRGVEAALDVKLRDVELRLVKWGIGGLITQFGFTIALVIGLIRLLSS